MAIRISGMNSGLDTDAIVEAMVANVKSKKEKYEKQKTKLEWTQDKWKDLNTKIYNLYNTANNMRWSSAYNLKKTSVSDATKATVTTSNTAVVGTQTLNILKIAQSGYLTGGKLGMTANTSTTLAELGYSGGDGTINVDKGDGTSVSISVSSTTTIENLTDQLKDAGLNASLDTTNNRIFVSSKVTGTENDFNLIAGDTKGLEALKALGLTTSIDGSSTTAATYKKYGAYASDGNGGILTDDEIRSNLTSALADYKAASSAYNSAKTQNENLSLIAKTYGSAYSGVQDFYATYGLDNDLFRQVALVSSSDRANTLITDSGDQYTKIEKADSDGNAVFSKKNDDGTTSYIKAKETYTDTEGNVYTKKDSSYIRTDAEGKEITYSGNTEDLTKHVDYYAATEKITGKTGEKDDDGNEISYDISTRQNAETGKTEYYFTDAKGKEYVSSTPTGDFKSGDETIKISDVSYDYETGAVASGVESASERYNTYLDAITATVKDSDGSLTDDEAKARASSILTTFSGNLSTVNSIESQAAEETDSAAENSKTLLIQSVKDAYADNGGASGVTELTNSMIQSLSSFTATMNEQSEIMKANEAVASLAAYDTDSEEYANALEQMVNTAKTGAAVLNDSEYSAAAVKIDGSDAEIKLNGVVYTNSTNNITVNGLTVNATAVTGDGDENAITITTQTDVQGLYDKIKEFISEFNKVINELVSEYNAEYVKSSEYEPLTDDQKEEMSDKEIEEWETKIKKGLLRHDSTLDGVISAMTSSMFSSITIGDRSYSLSDFGIETSGYLNSSKNEYYAFHIAGDEDDATSSGLEDKLMAMINSDPDTVADFFKELTSTLYKNLDSKMKSSTLSSAYTVYNDKQMTTQLSEYTSLIKTWQEKLEDREDYYYSKFTTMEKAMASLNSTQSALSGYFQ